MLGLPFNVGIEAGIHNFRRISYRLFFAAVPSYPKGVSRTFMPACRLAGLGSWQNPHFVGLGV